MFLNRQSTIKVDFARYMFHVERVDESERRQQPTRMREERRQIPLASAQPPPVAGEGGEAAAGPPDQQAPDVVQQAISDKIPRNAPCPCGSGKKYKQCHGRPGADPL